MAEEQGPNVSFTTKEMLVRMDGKLDTVLAKQQGYDVEQALLKARVERIEGETAAWIDESRRDRERLAKNLETQEAKMDEKVEDVIDSQTQILIRQKTNARVLAAVVILAQVLEAVIIISRSH